MTAAMVKLRDELYCRLRFRLGLNIARWHIAVFSEHGDAVMSLGFGYKMTVVRMPWSEISKRHIYEDIFEISVLVGVLGDGIYGGG